MMEGYNKKIRSINPWIRFLCVVLAAVLVGVSTNMIVANLVAPLTAQSTLTLDAAYLPKKEANGLSGTYSSQSVTASKDERMMRLLLAVDQDLVGTDELDARYEELKPVIAQTTQMDAISAELDVLIENTKLRPAKEAELAALNEQLMAMYTEIGTLMEAESAASMPLAVKQAELDEANAKIDGYLNAADRAALDAQIADAQALLAEQEAALAECEAEIADLKARQEYLEAVLDVQQRIAEGGEVDAAQYAAVMDAAKAEAEQNAAELDTVKSTLTQKNSNGRELKKNVNETTKLIAELQAKAAVEMTEAELAEAKAAAAALAEEVEALKKEVEPKTAAVNDMNARIAELNEQIMALTNDLSAMEPQQLRKLGAVPESTADQVAYVADMRDRVAVVERVEKLRGYLNIANQGEDSLTVKAQADTADEAIILADQYTAALKEQVSARVAKTAQENLTAVQKTLTTAEKTLTDLPAALEKQQEKAASSEAALAQAQADKLQAETDQADAAAAQSACLVLLLDQYAPLPEDKSDLTVWTGVLAALDELTAADKKAEKAAKAIETADKKIEKEQAALDQAKAEVEGHDAKVAEAEAAVEAAVKAVAD